MLLLTVRPRVLVVDRLSRILKFGFNTVCNVGNNSCHIAVYDKISIQLLETLHLDRFPGF